MGKGEEEEKKHHREIEKRYTTGYQNLLNLKKKKKGKAAAVSSNINYTSITGTHVDETKLSELPWGLQVIRVQLGTSTFHRKAHLPGFPRATGRLLLPSSPSGWCGPVPWRGRGAGNYPKRKTAHLDITWEGRAWSEATVSQWQTQEGRQVPTTG